MISIKKLQNNTFVRRVAVLVGGTAIGQAVAILALPILTRLYGPEAFSVLAVYVAVLTIVASVSGLCFEYAIPLPRQKHIAAALCVLALASTLLLSIALFFVLEFAPQFLNKVTENKIEQYLWLIPIGVFFVGLYNALQYWSTRNKKFSLISKTRVTQSLAGTGVKLTGGLLNPSSSLGLIIGQLIAQGFGFIGLGLSLIKNDLKAFISLKKKHFKIALYKYQNFPKFTTLEVLSNNASAQLPVILIAYYAVGEEAGYLMIAMQLLSAPLGMLSGAVSQVYLAEGADSYHRGELEAFTKKTMLGLAKIASAPLLGLLFVAPLLTPYFLGDNWSRTGVLISWMVPWFFVQFVTSPVSTSLYFTGNQKLAFILQCFGFAFRVGVVWLAGLTAQDYIGEAYAISGLLFYLIYLAVVLSVVKEKRGS